MNYIIQVNSITINGRTYRKNEVVSGVRFSETQVKDFLDGKVISEEAKPVPATPAPDPKEKK